MADWQRGNHDLTPTFAIHRIVLRGPLHQTRRSQGRCSPEARWPAGSTVLPRTAAAEREHEKPDPVFSEDARTSLVPAAVGGPMLRDHQAISLRWLGCSCYELVHRGKGLTCSMLGSIADRARGPWAFFRRTWSAPTRFSSDTLILITSRMRHRSPPGLAPSSTARQSRRSTPRRGRYAPASHLRTVTGLGGEVFQFDGFTVEAILAHHAVGPTRTNAKGERPSERPLLRRLQRGAGSVHCLRECTARGDAHARFLRSADYHQRNDRIPVHLR